jgi:hypothetical protein
MFWVRTSAETGTLFSTDTADFKTNTNKPRFIYQLTDFLGQNSGFSDTNWAYVGYYVTWTEALKKSEIFFEINRNVYDTKVFSDLFVDLSTNRHFIGAEVDPFGN